jgi:tetratricopeptide (TPR) repeat protein
MWESVLALDVRMIGDGSAEYANDLNNYAVQLTSLHRTDDAIAALTKAAAIHGKLFGDDSSEVAIELGNLAEAQILAGRYADAIASCDRAIASLDARHEDVSAAFPLTTRGQARLHAGDLASARADLERAAKIRARPDMEPGELAKTRLYLAEVLAAQHEVAAARAQLEPALAALRTIDDVDLLHEAEALAAKLGPTR